MIQALIIELEGHAGKGSVGLAMNIDGTNTVACLKPIDVDRKNATCPKSLNPANSILKMKTKHLASQPVEKLQSMDKYIWNILISSKQRKIQQNLQGLGIDSHHNEL
ncbi:putative succinate dehydrogenase [Corchorus olitorius]|uniref:Succinate dehydrogenase n=1 Tax=Corchorus olitorius TaxID=93759 RepID=A0A1R3G0D0_9ROSI|nr:putative succinate dehydrogenase [Corchorus olitorius]